MVGSKTEKNLINVGGIVSQVLDQGCERCTYLVNLSGSKPGFVVVLKDLPEKKVKEYINAQPKSMYDICTHNIKLSTY